MEEEIRNTSLRLAKTPYGRGVFALKDFEPGEIVLEFHGERVEKEMLPFPYEEAEDRYLQIGPSSYIGPSGQIDDYVNHSCSPNTGLSFAGEGVFLKAIEKILTGAEITFDYSTSLDEDEWELRCSCGSPRCRGVVRDFRKLPEEVRNRYRQLGIVPEFLLK